MTEEQKTMHGATVRKIKPTEGKIGLFVVYPETAQHWLETANTKNRHLRKHHVDRIAADMLGGRWKFTGAPIVFDTEGRLADGQHRLAAIAKSGLPLPMMIIDGVSTKAFAVIDCGAKRTAGDVLGVGGDSNGKTQASVLPMVAAYDANDGELPVSWPMSNSEVLDLKAQYPNLGVVTWAANQAAQAAGLPLAPSVAGFAYYVCHRINPNQARAFFGSLFTGEGLEAGDPALAARRRLMACGNENGSRRVRRQHADVIFHAWNAYRQGRSIKVIRTNPKEFTTAQ